MNYHLHFNSIPPLFNLIQFYLASLINVSWKFMSDGQSECITNSTSEQTVVWTYS